jgi:hypothetical protein
MFSLTLNLFRRKDFDMSFEAKFQPVLDGINALTAKVASLQAEIANSGDLQAKLDAANATIAQSAQNETDTVSALTAALPTP